MVSVQSIAAPVIPPNAKSSAKPATRLTNAVRGQFLVHLSQTANVSASARAVGITSNAVYAERRRSPAFRGAWTDALAEGYARLEADLLAEALQAANGKISDGTLKARAQKHRLGMVLLSAHRAAVKGGASPIAPPVTADIGVLKAQLILKLTQMRDRAGIPLGGIAASDPLVSGASGDVAP